MLGLQCFAMETGQGDVRVGLSFREPGSQSDEVMGVDARGGESLKLWPPSCEGEHAGREHQNQEETGSRWETRSLIRGEMRGNDSSAPVSLHPVQEALACGSPRTAAPPESLRFDVQGRGSRSSPGLSNANTPSHAAALTLRIHSQAKTKHAQRAAIWLLAAALFVKRKR